MRSLAIAFLLVLAVLPSPASAASGWAWPVQGELATRYRNGANPYAGGQHRGIDVAAPPGRAVTAATAGTVTFAGSVGSSGLTVSIRTADGRFDTSYLHLGEIDVRKGDAVRIGTPVGSVGTTGRGSIAEPHLHFGVRAAGSEHAYRDPLDFLPAPPASPQPRPVPISVPVAVPVRPQPAPVPGRVPFSAPAPERVPWPARLPAPARLPGALPIPGPLPLGRPARAPRPAAVRRPLAQPRPAAPRVPAGQPDRFRPRLPSAGRVPGQRDRPHEAAPRPELGPPARPALGPELGRQPAVADRAPDRVGGGFDTGWAIACAGLLLAGAALLRRDAAGKAAGRARAGVAQLLRPLVGRG